MSIETLLAANIKAVEANTAALTSFAEAVTAGINAGGKKTAAKDKEKATPAASTETPTTGAAASTPLPGATVATPTPLDATSPLAIAATQLARSIGRDAAVAVMDKFGAMGRASNIKDIDRPAALAAIQAEQKRFDDAKAAAAAAPQEQSLI